MSTIIFSQSSIFHLYRLSHLAFASTGIRHRLSDESTMLSLIKYCASSPQHSIRRQLNAFLSTVDDETIALLVTQKIIPSSHQRLSVITHVA